MLKNNRRAFFATIGAALFASKIPVTKTIKASLASYGDYVVVKTVSKLSAEDLECAEMLGRSAARNIDQMMWNTIKYDLT